MKSESSHYVLMKRAKRKSRKTGYSDNAHFFADKLTGQEQQKGPYFDVQQLTHYYDGKISTVDSFANTATSSMYAVDWYDRRSNGNANTLLQTLFKTIQDYGFNRLSYIGSGGFSIAFQTHADANGEKHVLTIGEALNPYVAYPLMLPPMAHMRITGKPAKETQYVNGTALEAVLEVRVMPKVNLEKVTDDDVKFLRKVAEKSGLKEIKIRGHGNEINKANIGILEYEKIDKDTHAITHVRLPYLIDWGMFEPPHPKDFEELEKHWKEDPDLKAYYEAASYLKTKAGVAQFQPDMQEARLFFDAHAIDYGKTSSPDAPKDPERFEALLNIYRDFKLTPAELKSLITQADKNAGGRAGPATLYAQAEKLTETMDPSLPHNSFQPRNARDYTADIVRGLAQLFGGAKGLRER